MLVGILSDTHDRVDAARAAVRILRHRGAEYFIHCGDVGGEQVLDELAGLQCAFVWGNNDWDRTSLERYAAEIGLQCCGVFADLEIGGKRFAVIHGDDMALKKKLIDEQQHDYLLQGHTHVMQERKVGSMRLINPGALYRAHPKSVALLETTTDVLEFVELKI